MIYDFNASGIFDINDFPMHFTFIANQVTTIQLTTENIPGNTNACKDQTEGIGNKGVHITTDKSVIVYFHILNAKRPGLFLSSQQNFLVKKITFPIKEPRSGRKPE